MSEEGQLQVWYHRMKNGKDLPESVDVHSDNGVRAVVRAAEREGHHAIQVMQKRSGRWVQVPMTKFGMRP